MTGIEAGLYINGLVRKRLFETLTVAGAGADVRLPGRHTAFDPREPDMVPALQGGLPRRALVMVSGGADSTCLLHLCVETCGELDIELEAVHVDYGLRRDSGDDRRFLMDLCRSLGVKLHCRILDPEEIRELDGGGNLQERARDIRNLFCESIDPECPVFTGHNFEDQVETFFINLLRGAGTPGLSGMREVCGRRLRPLLPVPRECIERFLRIGGIPFRCDSSNEGDRYLRNRIRHHLLPVLRTLAPSAERSVFRAMELLARDRDCLSSIAGHAWVSLCRREPVQGLSFDCKGLEGLHPGIRSRLLHRAVQEVAGEGVYPSCRLVGDLERLIGRPDGARLDMREALSVVKSMGRLYFHCPALRGYEVALVPGGEDEYSLNVAGFQVIVQRLPSCSGSAVDREDVGTGVVEQVSSWPACGPGEILIDEERVASAWFRAVRPGEKIVVEGRRGARSVAELLAEAGVPLPLRRFWPVLCDDEGPLWIAGVRRALRDAGAKSGSVVRLALNLEAVGTYHVSESDRRGTTGGNVR